VTKLSLSVFVFSFTFVLAAMVRVGNSVPYLISVVAGYGSLVSVGVFLYLIDHVGKLLRPSGVFKSVTSQAHRVIDEVYPRRLTDSPDGTMGASLVLDKKPARIVPSTTAGVVLAFDQEGLVALGTRHGCVIELMRQVGNFVAPG